MNNEPHTPEPGDVYQINEKVGAERGGYIGAFVLVTEVKSFGIQGFVHHVDTHLVHGEIYLRLNFSEIDYIGRAALVPKREG